ncbi:MAG: stage V sporulation protein AA [Clostridiales bacterium]|nr:stage V sporulation protein AA [Clostridiales bacterium]
MKNDCLYIKVDKNSLVNKKRVLIKDVVKIYGVNNGMVNDINHTEILQIKSDKEANYVFSILKIIEIISEKYPSVEIINLGENDFIIHYEPPKPNSKLLEIIKTILVCLVVFTGSVFTIMTFNNDVDVIKIFDDIYLMFTGVERQGSNILELSYAIGLPLGILIFYSHFSKAKIGIDPTPMQVQMRLYEEDVDTTIIENANREGKTFDVN